MDVCQVSRTAFSRLLGVSGSAWGVRWRFRGEKCSSARGLPEKLPLLVCDPTMGEKTGWRADSLLGYGDEVCSRCLSSRVRVG